MGTIIAISILCLGLTLYVMRKDRKRRAAYEAWKKEKGLTTEDCGI